MFIGGIKIMNKYFVLLPVLAVLTFGCSAPSEYKMRGDPTVELIGGDESLSEWEKKVKRENIEARETGSPPIFQPTD